MKHLKVSSLKAGMAFTHPVYVDSQNLLVPENIEIREKDIARLEKWGIEIVKTEGNLIEKTQNRGEPLSAAGLCLVEDKQIHSLYNTCLMNLGLLFDGLLKKVPIAPEKCTDIVTKLLPKIGKASEDWLNYALCVNRNQEYLTQSSLNTMICASVIGSKMSLSNETLKQLGLAALLHDVGMQWIPKSIRAKKEKLLPKEFEAIKAHPLYSYKIMTEKLRCSKEVAGIAMRHHERWDGKGYPSHLAGDTLPLTTRILSLADAFEAMMWDKPYRESLLGYKAIRQIINDNSRRFDAEVVKVFVQCMGIYPVGSFVILNRGAVGLVVQSRPVTPLRPMIRILVTEEGKKLEKDQRVLLDLLKDQSSFIVRSFNPRVEKKFTM